METSVLITRKNMQKLFKKNEAKTRSGDERRCGIESWRRACFAAGRPLATKTGEGTGMSGGRSTSWNGFEVEAPNRLHAVDTCAWSTVFGTGHRRRRRSASRIVGRRAPPAPDTSIAAVCWNRRCHGRFSRVMEPGSATDHGVWYISLYHPVWGVRRQL